jgi:hypothetical protein
MTLTYDFISTLLSVCETWGFPFGVWRFVYELCCNNQDLWSVTIFLKGGILPTIMLNEVTIFIFFSFF